MKRKLIYLLVAVVILVGAFLIVTGKKNGLPPVTAEVKKGPFEILVYTSGQLEAENFEKILIPEELYGSNIHIYEIKIADIIEEGTVVQKGDYIASLDHKAVEEVLVVAQQDLENAMNDFEDAKMDSNLNLSTSRDEIISALEQVEEMKIILEESVYESPSIIRKAEMDLDKAHRNLERSKLAYKLRTQQAATRVNRRVLNMTQKENRVKELEKVYQTLDIYAKKPGMLIYAKDRFGDKIKTGSTVSRWMPVIATLPDLSKMISVTYVNEIDISKVKPGQKVTLGIDAFPDKKLEGEVFAVANIGQPLPKSDAKVFEVKIRINSTDTELRPAMTTSNVIQTGLFKEELYIPSDAIFENDSLRYVYHYDKTVSRQVVETGEENENYSIILRGLQLGDKILISKPVDEKDLPINGMEIYYDLLKKEEAKRDSLNKISADIQPEADIVAKEPVSNQSGGKK